MDRHAGVEMEVPSMSTNIGQGGSNVGRQWKLAYLKKIEKMTQARAQARLRLAPSVQTVELWAEHNRTTFFLREDEKIFSASC